MLAHELRRPTTCWVSERWPTKTVLRFSDIRQAPAGTLVALLSEAYAPLLSLAGDSGRGEMAKWQEFDDLAYSSSVVGRCVFLSWSDDTIAGFGSFDPRGAPQFGTVGHHCVLPSFQRKGFGRLQLQEIVDRLASSRRLNCVHLLSGFRSSRRRGESMSCFTLRCPDEAPGKGIPTLKSFTI